MILAPDHRRKLERTIEGIEQRSSAQVVVVLADSANKYTHVHLCHAGIAAIFIPMIVFMVLPITWYQAFSLQVALFVFLAIFLQYTGITNYVVPRSIKEAHSSKLAREQLVERKITSISHRRCVLVFVSYQEKYVDIIPDIGLVERVDQVVWDQIASDTRALLRARGVMLAFQFAVEKCGEVLIEQFPAENGNPDDRDNLSNHLILI